MKTIWMVSGGAEAVPGIKRAREMGLRVVVSDGNPQAPGLALADDRVIASTYDVDATVSEAQKYRQSAGPIDGVISIAADVPLTVATMAAELGLPGIPVQTARLAADKLAMKQRFQAAGIPTSWFSPVGSASDLRRIADERGYPLVVKPVDSRGARGVLRLTADVDLEWAFGHSRSFSPTSRTMVEEYLEGPQVSTESIIVDGQAFTPGFTDRNYEYLDRFAPYIIENGGQQPSALNHEDQASIARLAEEAGRALGVKTGVVKGDMVRTPEGPKVVEIATRLSGGWFCTDQIPLATGVDLVGTAIRLALGEKVEPSEFRVRRHLGVAIRYFFPEPGRVVAIENADHFADAHWVHRLGLFVGPDDLVEAVTNHTKRAGFVITTGDTRDEAVARARHVVDTIQIRTVST